ncbi:MAG: UDP-N-acetylmuramate dehydrogenase [Clostridia bacterium]|nr:UDP-N-acetylmuramate dehydrogenase [Clostridia bacterium]
MNIVSSYPMASATTFKCGGIAKWFVCPDDLFEFASLLKLHQGKKYFILGNGSNTLCPDKGYDGLVICTKNLNRIKHNETSVVCESGVDLFNLNSYLAENNLGGLEWSYGIPGTIGGATFMNSGAFGSSMSDFIEKVAIFDDNKIKLLYKNEINFSYRKSSLQGLPIFKVWLNLKKSDKENIIKQQNLVFEERKLKQPLTYPSAGSVFKRTENIIPAKIIDKLGLKGVKIGGAEISKKHSGFIVNSGGATSTDVLNLIKLIQEAVLGKENIRLEQEIIIME